MAEQRALAQQPETVVDVGVALRPREQAAHRRDLVEVLAKVGLEVAVGMLRQQRARRLELGVARGHRKARRDRVVQAAAAVPALDQRLALAIALLGGIEQRRGRAAVHHHLAGDHARAAPLGFGEQRLGRFRMHRAVDRRRRGAVAQQLVQEEAGDARGMGGVGEPLLLDEGVFLQPVEQLGAVARDHLGLRQVDVGVDQPRQDQVACMVVDRRIFRQLAEHRARIAQCCDPAVLDQHDAVLEIDVARCLADLGGIVLEAQETPAERATLGHGLLRRRAGPVPGGQQPRSSGSSSVTLAGGIASLAAACR